MTQSTSGVIVINLNHLSSMLIILLHAAWGESLEALTLHFQFCCYSVHAVKRPQSKWHKLATTKPMMGESES